MLKVKDKELVVPGELVATGQGYLVGNGIFREKEDIYTSSLGLVSIKGNFLKVIPLVGQYMPSPNDLVVGVIEETMLSSWIVDINAPYEATLPLSLASERFIEKGEELTRYFDVGDIILAKVKNVTKSKQVGLTMRGRGLRKLYGGRIIEINPSKVPRVIGKGGTMVTLIKNETNSEIFVGQNGRIWIKAPVKTENLVVQAMLKIEKEAHIPGLTDRIKKFLRESNGKTRKTNSQGKKA